MLYDHCVSARFTGLEATVVHALPLLFIPYHPLVLRLSPDLLPMTACSKGQCTLHALSSSCVARTRLHPIEGFSPYRDEGRNVVSRVGRPVLAAAFSAKTSSRSSVMLAIELFVRVLMDMS